MQLIHAFQPLNMPLSGYYVQLDMLYNYMIAKWVYGYALPLHVLNHLGVRKDSLLVLFGSGQMM